MPLLSGSAAQPSQSNGGEASFGMSGQSGGQGANGTPHARRAGARPSFSGGRRTSLDAQDWRRRSLSGSRRRSLSQAFSEGPSPLHRPGWRGDLGQFQGPRGRLQDRRRSFSVPLSPVASVVRCFCRLATRHALAAEAAIRFQSTMGMQTTWQCVAAAGIITSYSPCDLMWVFMWFNRTARRQTPSTWTAMATSSTCGAPT